MTPADYKLFSYFWFLRYEAALFVSMIIAVTFVILFKFVVSKSIQNDFSIKLRNNAEAVSEDVIVREKFVITKFQVAFYLGVVGALALLDPSANRVFKGNTLDETMQYINNRKTQGAILIALFFLQLISNMIMFVLLVVAKDDKSDV
jgi:predicted negative regulator of RcsB-dependent stress response